MHITASNIMQFHNFNIYLNVCLYASYVRAGRKASYIGQLFKNHFLAWNSYQAQQGTLPRHEGPIKLNRYQMCETS